MKYQYTEPGTLLNPSEPLPVLFTVEFYDSILELPMRRLNEFNIHLAQDAGIGSTLGSFDERMGALVTALNSGSISNAIAEHYNARLGLYLMLEEGISTTARCLADVVRKVNGASVATHSEAEMMDVHHTLSIWMSQAQAEEVAANLKKKFNGELKVAFPELFPDTEELEFYINLLKRARLQLNEALQDADVSRAMGEIDSWLAEQMAPDNYDFSNTENAVEAKRRGFAVIVAGLAMRGIPGAAELTAYDFHATIQAIKNNTPKPKSTVTQ